VSFTPVSLLPGLTAVYFRHVICITYVFHKC